MKRKITQKDKEDFLKINKTFLELDAETQIYILGYAHGLGEKENLLTTVPAIQNRAYMQK